jgi:hypothetical protein
VKLQVEVPQVLLSNPSGPLPKEQEQSLLLEMRTAKNAKQPAVALLSTIYSRQQADKPALQSAASDLLPWLELLRRKILARVRTLYGSQSNPRGQKPCVSFAVPQ